MRDKSKLKDLIIRAKQGDEDALNEVVGRFLPIISKHSRRLGYEDACSELVEWIINAIQRYKPNSPEGEEEFEQLFSKLDEKNT